MDLFVEPKIESERQTVYRGTYIQRLVEHAFEFLESSLYFLVPLELYILLE